MNYTNCIVRNCRNRVYPGSSIKFHPLPKDRALQNEWLSVLLIKKMTYSYSQDANWKESALVCGDHFTSADYDDCNRLLDNAVPIKKPVPYSHRGRPRLRDLKTSSVQIESTVTQEDSNEPIKETSTNETNSSTENNEAANPSSGSDSVAFEYEEEIETIVEVEDDDTDVPETIRGIIDDWEGSGAQTATTKVATASHVSKNTDDELNVPETIKACRVCLAMTGKMFSLRERKHQQFYTQATGIPMVSDDVFPQFLCWECAGRVFSAVKFRIKARAAKDVLMGILYDHGKITMKSVRSINRREHKLTSELSEKYMKPNDHINLSEIQLRNISDIMSNDSKNIVPTNEADVVVLQNNDDDHKLFNDNDLIPDRTLIDHDNITEVETDIHMYVSENALDTGVRDNENDDEQIENYLENGNDVEGNDNDLEEDNDREENEVDENFGNKLSKQLWVGKVSKHVAWKLPVPTEDFKEIFTVTPLTTDEEISILQKSRKTGVKYKCDVCHRGYQNLSFYENHRVKHEQTHGAEECEICKLRMCNKTLLTRHKRECHGKLYSCKKCSYYTADKSSAQYHRRQHISNIEENECRICSKKLPSRVQYYHHMRNSHPCEVPCEYCGLTFVSSTGKKIHQWRCRKDKVLSGPYCKTCDVTFASQKAHDTHLTKSSRHNNSIIYANRLQPEYYNHFTITKLTEDEEIAELQSRDNSAARYKCDSCHRGYLSYPCYKEHILKHTEKYGAFVCSICKIRKRSENQMVHHKSKFHGKRFNCKLCTYVTRQQKLARNHFKRDHKDNSDVKYECPHCLKQFNRITTYHGHLRTRHPCDVACEYCGHTYRSERGKVFHRKMTHRFDNYELPLSGPHCATCDVTFATQHAHDTHLTKSARHVTDKASNIRNNKIGDWNHKKAKDYYYRNTTKSTRVFHNVTCEQCNVVALSVRMYICHFRRQHPGMERAQYKDILPSTHYTCVCEYCGKIFGNEAYLKDHTSVHTGVQFECHHCGKKFARKLLLINHMNIHNDKRKAYICPICRKAYATRSSHFHHIKSCHSNMKPYACEACGKRFVVPSLLRSHIDHVHNKVPWPPRDRREERTRRLTRNQINKI